MPVAVFLVGVLLGTEKYSFMYAANMVIVAIGVATASYGASLVGTAFDAEPGELHVWLVVQRCWCIRHSAAYATCTGSRASKNLAVP